VRCVCLYTCMKISEPVCGCTFLSRVLMFAHACVCAQVCVYSCVCVCVFVFRPVQYVFWHSSTWLSFEFGLKRKEETEDEDEKMDREKNNNSGNIVVAEKERISERRSKGGNCFWVQYIGREIRRKCWNP